MDKITIEHETLLPCPFCGAKAEILTIPEDRPDAGAMFVQCCDSRCMTSSALLYPLMDDVRALLVERWNRRAALAAQPAEQCPVKSYWLIECKNGFTGWYTGKRLDCRFFDTDPHKAYKFASKELAENKISERGHSCMIVTEHVDIAAQPAEPVAEVASKHGDPERFGEREIRVLADLRKIPYGTKLYAAQPAPAVVPLTDEWIYKLADSLWEQGHIQSLSKDTARTFARAVLAAAGDKPCTTK